MLVTLKEVLKVAEEKEIAIGAFNAPNLESLQAVMAAAEEMDLPVIIQFAPVHEVHNPLALMGPLMVDFAKKAKVPVCVHLDHGDSIDRVKFALSMGFTSVMYDGSTLPYEENVANTKLAAELAHAQGADIEAELGSMAAVKMMRPRFTQIRYRQKISSQEPALTHWHVPSELPMVFI